MRVNTYHDWNLSNDNTMWTLTCDNSDRIELVISGDVLDKFAQPIDNEKIFEILNDFVTANTKYYGLVLGLVILSFVLGLKQGLLDWIVIKFKESKNNNAQN